MERDNIIKALECCTFYCDKEHCKYKSHDNPIACMVMKMIDVLSLIKELTEERDGFENLVHTAIETQNRMSETIEELTSENKLLNVELGNANSEILRLIEENERLRAKKLEESGYE